MSSLPNSIFGLQDNFLAASRSVLVTGLACPLPHTSRLSLRKIDRSFSKSEFGKELNEWH